MKVCLFDLFHADVHTFGVDCKTQRFHHTSDDLAIACVIELKVAPTKQLGLEADLDVDLNKVVLFAVGSVDGKVHAIWGEVAPAPVSSIKNFFNETYGALPGKVVDRGAVSRV